MQYTGIKINGVGIYEGDIAVGGSTIKEWLVGITKQKWLSVIFQTFMS